MSAEHVDSAIGQHDDSRARRATVASRPVRRLISYVRPYRSKFIAGLLCSFVTTAISLLAPMILERALDELASGIASSKLLAFGTGLLSVGCMVGALRFVTRYVLMTVSRDIEYDIRNELFAHLLRLPVEYFRRHRTGEIISRAINDLGSIRLMIGPAVLISAATVFTCVAAIGMMLTISARLTLISLLPLSLIGVVVRLSDSGIQNRFQQIQAQLAAMSSAVQETLSSIRLIRAYAREHEDEECFRRLSAEYMARSRSLIAIQCLVVPSTSFLFGLSALLVLWAGSLDVITGRVTVGQFVAFFSYLLMFTWPMIAFGWVTSVVQRGWPCWKRVLEVLDAPPAESDDALALCPEEPLPVNGAIEFRHLTFAYHETPVLRDVSLRIDAGQTVAIVGPSGAGKSTLVSVLTRLHEPPRGTVFVDGIDVRELPLRTLRGATGVVPQEPILFSDTLAANIGFGLPSASWTEQSAARQSGLAEVSGGPDHRIVSGAAAACLDEDIARFERGYQTAVGERGVTLSGGQRQRTAIARALATSAPILILDDPFSSSDAATAQRIVTRLQDATRRRTCIIVSHRMATIRHADLIVVLNAGEIVERGSHQVLMQARGMYAAMHRRQSLAEHLAAS